MASTENLGQSKKSAKFHYHTPQADADASEVRKWIKSWFDKRGVKLDGLDSTMNMIYWDGQDIHRQTESGLAWDFKSLGLRFYADSLAYDMFQALKDEKVRIYRSHQVLLY